MPADSTPSPSREPVVRRLLKPLILVSPVAAVVIVPALFYGSRARSVAAEADQALVDAVAMAEDDEGVALDPGMLCPSVDADEVRTRFAVLALDDDTHKSSVTGVGFDMVVIDLKGWVERPASAVGTTDGIDHRDDITISMEQADDGAWCVAGVRVFGSSAG